MYPITARINARFLYYYMLSEDFVEMATELGTRAILPKINKAELNIIPVPVPSYREQEEIVIKIERLLNIADSIQNKCQLAEEDFEQLEKSVLQQAFNGTLINHLTQLESAEVLLEQIILEQRKIVSLDETNEDVSPSNYNQEFSMKVVEKSVIQAQIKELAAEYIKGKLYLSMDDIKRIRLELESSSKLEFDDFSQAFIELAQDKISSSENDPYFISVDKDGKLNFKIKDES